MLSTAPEHGCHFCPCFKYRPAVLCEVAQDYDIAVAEKLALAALPQKGKVQ